MRARATLLLLLAVAVAAVTVQRPPTIVVQQGTFEHFAMLHSVLRTEWGMCITRIDRTAPDTFWITGAEPVVLGSFSDSSASFHCPEGSKGSWHNHVAERSVDSVGCYFSVPDVREQDSSRWVLMSFVSCGSRTAPSLIYRLHPDFRRLADSILGPPSQDLRP